MTTTDPLEPNTPTDDRVPPPTCWPSLRYDDAPAAIAFLEAAFGAEVALVVAGDEPGVVLHAEVHLPHGGGVMLGSTQRASTLDALPGGVGAVYAVIDRPDERFEQAVAAGASVVMAPTDQPHGSRDFVVRDPEGVHWCFGTYRGAPRAR